MKGIAGLKGGAVPDKSRSSPQKKTEGASRTEKTGKRSQIDLQFLTQYKPGVVGRRPSRRRWCKAGMHKKRAREPPLLSERRYHGAVYYDSNGASTLLAMLANMAKSTMLASKHGKQSGWSQACLPFCV